MRSISDICGPVAAVLGFYTSRQRAAETFHGKGPFSGRPQCSKGDYAQLTRVGACGRWSDTIEGGAAFQSLKAIRDQSPVGATKLTPVGVILGRSWGHPRRLPLCPDIALINALFSSLSKIAEKIIHNLSFCQVYWKSFQKG